MLFNERALAFYQVERYRLAIGIVRLVSIPRLLANME